MVREKEGVKYYKERAIGRQEVEIRLGEGVKEKNRD